MSGRPNNRTLAGSFSLLNSGKLNNLKDMIYYCITSLLCLKAEANQARRNLMQNFLVASQTKRASVQNFLFVEIKAES